MLREFFLICFLLPVSKLITIKNVFKIFKLYYQGHEFQRRCFPLPSTLRLLYNTNDKYLYLTLSSCHHGQSKDFKLITNIHIFKLSHTNVCISPTYVYRQLLAKGYMTFSTKRTVLWNNFR